MQKGFHWHGASESPLMLANGDCINIDESNIDEVLTAFGQDGDVGIYIENMDRTIENYLFELSTTNFTATYDYAKGQ